MNANIQVVPHVDALMERYNELADQQNINSAAYALEWSKLAADAAAANRPALAGMCAARADFYMVQNPGEYIRLITGSFSELVEVPA